MSGCSCVWVDVDGSGPAVSDAVTRRAAKVHGCCECGDEIPKGAVYECYSGLYEGRWSRYRTCLPCVQVRNALFCGGWIWGECWARIRENFRDGAKLLPCLEECKGLAAREKLAAAYRSAVPGVLA